jgi:predicted nucleic acid-binding protein
VPSVFVDSGAWIALLVARDSRHTRALETFRNLPPRTQLITTNYVIAETLTWMLYRGYRSIAFQLRARLEASEQQGLLRIEWVSEREHEQAWTYLERYNDQRFSFCDCTSFVVCAARDVDFVFGFDSDFRTAGFDLRPGGD